MYPLMRNGDLLGYTEDCSSVSSGDVILFSHEDRIVVHRVVKTVSSGLITRGDSSFRNDPETVSRNDVTGICRRVYRRNRTIRVLRGFPGTVQMAFGHIVRVSRSVLYAVFHPLYRFLARTGVFRLVWKPSVRRLSFHTPQGKLVKFVWRRRTIARWYPDTGRFVCRFPFALFLSPPSQGEVR